MPARHRHGLRGDADEGAAHAAVLDDLAQHELRGVARDRKADALRARDHRGVDADHLAARGDQRPAGIAGVERRVGLDHVLDQPAGAGAQATGRAPRSRRRSRSNSKPSGLPIATASWPRLEPLGIAERRRRQVARGAGAQQRQVGVGVLAEQPRLHAAALGVGQAQFARAVDHVAVGQHQAVGRDDDARADAAATAAAAVLAGRSTRTTAGPTRSATAVTASE